MPAGLQLAQESTNSSSLFVWIGILLFVVLALFGAVVWARRRLSPDEDFHGEGFTLGDLRELHKAGQLSDEEFDRAKSKLVEQTQAVAAQRAAARAEAAKHPRTLT